MASSSSNGYVCDTIPAPKLAKAPASRSPSPVPPATPPIAAFEAPILAPQSSASMRKSSEEIHHVPAYASQLTPPPGRKLCVRHQRMADEGTNLKLQQALDALPVEERSAVNAIWSNFSSSPHPRRALILHGLLTMCCFSQLSLLSEQLSHLIRIDPFAVLPSEVSLKILGYLDAQSLCRAAQVSKRWKALADDDILWRGICEQHIGQKCLKCGWGLPILEKRRVHRYRSPIASPSPLPAAEPKRKRDVDAPRPEQPPLKRQRSEGPESSQDASAPDSPPLYPHPDTDIALSPAHNPLLAPNDPTPSNTVTRPWKDVYCERLTIERNWRRGRCTVRTLSGHTDGVMCLQFSETLTHPAFPILITGSYDRTARVWNLETGREIHCLTGHTRAVRALQFDEAKLITASMDNTMRVWDWRAGKCLRVLEGHTEGVVCLNFDSNVLASGSVDTTVKVWNFRTGECFTLRGHRDWVNSVQLWDSNDVSFGCSSSKGAAVSDGTVATLKGECSKPCIDPGKMLFSASDDGTIRLWDLAKRTCLRQFTGHVGQVQSLKLLMVDEACDETSAEQSADQPEQPAPTPRGPRQACEPRSTTHHADTQPIGHDDRGATSRVIVHHAEAEDTRGRDRAVASSAANGARSSSVGSTATRTRPVLISGSLDNTIKVWDLETGKASQTLFGHIEGVWAVASDKLRLVSGSHDRTIKVWVREEGRCMATLVGHRGAVTCVALGEDKIVSGSDDGDVRIWSFSG
ncbi:WD40 repeat domain-containing protein [Phanerochaete sordida]|uniref:WD40 repeat domain-containing protein n=1 Tax=Phanerochaete sordida TaxID=48140 RepID=A0A9P3LK28_9APHY|nr:WD40 repeat domain-containing protein [Phanerochaete sordida]